jgi:general secretion pathway protein I
VSAPPVRPARREAAWVLRLRRRCAAAEPALSPVEGLGTTGAAAPAGFTLLEVMVALAVLAGAFMALAELGGSALRNHAYARDLSAATLLARGKLAELEERYEDLGFKLDGDESEEGDFADAGRPDVRWSLELVRPDPQLAPAELVSLLAGAEGGDPGELVAKLFGGGDAGASGDAQAGGPTTMAGAGAGLAGQALQMQLTAFGEQLKRSLRELRLTVSWNDGAPRSFTVTEHLVVLNPRAPGGARGDNPDLPPTVAGALPGTAGFAGGPGATGPQTGGFTNLPPGVLPGLGAPGTAPQQSPLGGGTR